MNKTFNTLTKSLEKDDYLNSLKAYLLLLPSYRRFPSDEEFKRELQIRDLYNFRSRSYWIRRLENYERKEKVSVGEYTIEHIMPQNENLSSAWKIELGPDWKRIHQTYLHTLGNLTLTAYNPDYSDKSFSEKRDMDKGFKISPLNLNQGLGHIAQWDEKSICQRADRLSSLALKVWPAPHMTEEQLNLFRKMPTSVSYTINDHPHLLSGKMRDVFEAFRKEILALDPCVNEEFLKLYIAYKAETNFVDVVPQARRLRLSVNIPFVEVNDPKGLCKDVTKLGRWGNGDVEVGLSSLDELPYIIGIVRQALERQMGDSE